MQKRVIITSLSADPQSAAAIAAKIRPYGFDAAGAVWQDNLNEMAWQGGQEPLMAKETAAWMILAPSGGIQTATVRYGLSMLTLAVKAERPSLPCFIVSTDGGPVQPESLPAPLAGMTCVAFADPTLCAKLVARANLPPQQTRRQYRINVLGSQQIGQWFEIGPPPDAEWRGALFGVCGAEIDFHAVGPSGALPENSVLNFPSAGMKISLQEREFLAWGVANELPSGSSYFARVRGNPESILFGPFPDSDDPELYHLRLS